MILVSPQRLAEHWTEARPGQEVLSGFRITSNQKSPDVESDWGRCRGIQSWPPIKRSGNIYGRRKLRKYPTSTYEFIFRLNSDRFISDGNSFDILGLGSFMWDRRSNCAVSSLANVSMKRNNTNDKTHTHTLQLIHNLSSNGYKDCRQVEPASCYQEVVGSIPLVCMSKCPYARHWTPNCSWCAGRHLAWQPKYQ